MKTQAERLFHELRKRWMTTGDLLALKVSVCPWKRIADGAHHLRDGESIAKKVNTKGRTVYRVVRVAG